VRLHTGYAQKGQGRVAKAGIAYRKKNEEGAYRIYIERGVGFMLRLSVCIEMMFRDLPFVERIARVASAGIPAFEFWGYDNKDIDAILSAKTTHNLEIGAHMGGSGIVKPGSEDGFAAQVTKSVEIAHKLGCKHLIVTTGNELQDISRQEQHDSIVSCLKAAAPVAEKGQVTLVLEPLNILVDHKGYYLSTSDEGFEIIRQVGSENVKVLYDIYHQQITEGNLIATITQNIDLIGHFHVADVPGRHEPGTGEINYRNVFACIDKTGYDGYVGLEYSPAAGDEESLQVVKQILG